MTENKDEDFPSYSHWNHRVIRKELEYDCETFVSFGIHEVYYDNDKKPTACTMEQMKPHGETLDELKKDLERFQKALEHPVLDYHKDFPQEEESDD